MLRALVLLLLAGCHHAGTCDDCADAGAPDAATPSDGCDPACDTPHGQLCQAGTCVDACAGAAAAHAYLGCEYWPTITTNARLNPSFHFAVVVANPQPAAVTVTITRGGALVATQPIAAGQVARIDLPWVYALSGNMGATSIAAQNATAAASASAVVPGGAFRLAATLPVAVYQFNPIEYELPASATCSDEGEQPDDTVCHSYTGDASLLLPTATLQADYLAVTSVGASASPAFVAVVATADGTHVHVALPAGAPLRAGPGVASAPPTTDYTLAAGDVVQLLAEGDLTGARVTADAPIAVFSGAQCADVPNVLSCDHLEEQLFPLGTWGKTVATVQTEPQIAGEPNLWRVLSGSDGNTLTFEPSSVHAPVTLDTGAFVELVAQGGFVVSGTGRVGVAQFMVGRGDVSSDNLDGDPSLGMVVPVEQHRSSYDFLAPATFTRSYVDAVAPLGAVLVLDGTPLDGTLTPLGASGLGWVRKLIPAGAHHLESTARFGITVSGVAFATSYLYPGGLDLAPVVVQ